MKRVLLLFLLPVLAGCATTQETSQLGYRISSIQGDYSSYRTETDQKIASLERDIAGIRQQMVNLSQAVESNNDKMKTMLGQLDEMNHRLRTAKESKPHTLTDRPSGEPGSEPPERKTKPEYEEQYREAFNAFQQGKYADAAKGFKDFLDNTPETPVKPNALYWMGESFIYLKKYDNAILAFQEVIDKYPKNERVPRALLSQAEAFNYKRDRRSAETILKKLVATHPGTEEASRAERWLKYGMPAATDAGSDKPDKPDKAKQKGLTVTSDAANLRSSPSRTGKIVSWVTKNSAFDILDEETDSTGKKWYKVRTKAGKEGWIHERFVKLH